MKRLSPRYVLVVAAVICAVPGTAFGGGLTADLVNSAKFDVSPSSEPEEGQEAARDPVLLKAQILLDRARFSPGVIDGWPGDNTVNAIKAFEKRHGLEIDGQLDSQVWKKLAAGQNLPVLVNYTITTDDVSGPFLENDPEPGDFAGMSKLKALSFNGPVELLAEKFHMDQDLLHALNPDATFDEAGSEIVVAHVAAEKAKVDVARVEVDKAAEHVRAFDENGALIATYPATIGSPEYPELSGTHTVRAVAISPVYYFDPESLKTLDVNLDTRAEIAAGPNNPVGDVWIDLSKDTFGIHGTPDPEKVGKETSHGCVRLTNWDALELAHMVRPGTEVVFLDN